METPSLQLNKAGEIPQGVRHMMWDLGCQMEALQPCIVVQHVCAAISTRVAKAVGKAYPG